MIQVGKEKGEKTQRRKCRLKHLQTILSKYGSVEEVNLLAIHEEGPRHTSGISRREERQERSE